MPLWHECCSRAKTWAGSPTPCMLVEQQFCVRLIAGRSGSLPPCSSRLPARSVVDALYGGRWISGLRGQVMPETLAEFLTCLQCLAWVSLGASLTLLAGWRVSLGASLNLWHGTRPSMPTVFSSPLRMPCLSTNTSRVCGQPLSVVSSVCHLCKPNSSWLIDCSLNTGLTRTSALFDGANLLNLRP
jgi:hypothetical protein